MMHFLQKILCRASFNWFLYGPGPAFPGTISQTRLSPNLQKKAKSRPSDRLRARADLKFSHPLSICHRELFQGRRPSCGTPTILIRILFFFSTLKRLFFHDVIKNRIFKNANILWNIFLSFFPRCLSVEAAISSIQQCHRVKLRSRGGQKTMCFFAHFQTSLCNGSELYYKLSHRNNRSPIYDKTFSIHFLLLWLNNGMNFESKETRVF